MSKGPRGTIAIQRNGLRGMTTEKDVVRIGSATLYCGDCRSMTFTNAGAIVTDPPYGIGFKWTGADRSNSKAGGLSWGRVQSKDTVREWQDISGDAEPFDPAPWLRFPQVILWGANNYGGLPAARRWLVWDKRRDTTPDDHGDAELAWTNLPGVVRVHRQLWRGIVREGEENVSRSPKHHPTQKPVALMTWCVEMTAGVVCDPYMGSGSTGVACARLGRPFIGVEIHRPHFEVACRRIAEALRQPSLAFSE